MQLLDLSIIVKELKNFFGFQTKIKLDFSLFLIGVHILTIYSTYYYAFPAKWQTLVYGFIIYHLGGLGITCGVHRLWTHKSYKATLPLQIFLALCFASCGQMPVYKWVKIHRQHHKYSDTDADPHNANRGFIYSHIGWLLLKRSDLVHEKSKLIDMSDFENDKLLIFDQRYSGIIRTLCMFLPLPLPIYFWNEGWKCALTWTVLLKFLALLHGGASVNSFAHKFGYKPYDKNIKSTDNQLIQWFVFGEGIHNYHHTFPNDYKCAEISDFLNVSTAWIRLWAKMGLAYDLKEPTPELIKAKVNRLNSSEQIKNNNKV